MKKKAKSAVLTFLIIICAGMIVISGMLLFVRLGNYYESENEYSQIEEQVVETLPENETEKDTEETPAPLEIDWDELLAINPDVIGWIYMPCLDISYPIMQSADNEYYLHRTINGTYLYAGSLFADCSNSSDFSDPNTIIYGHNMANGSMFGKFWHITYSGAADNDPYFWILTPQASYRYRIFSSFETTTMSEAYDFFEKGDSSFVSWIRKMKELSCIDTGSIQPQSCDRVVTLSTCSGTGEGGKRTLVLGIRN